MGKSDFDENDDEEVFMEPKSPEEWWPCFQRAMRSGDVEAVLRLYEPDASFVSPGGQVLSGHASLREEFRPLVEAKPDFVVTIRKIIRSGDLAMIHSEPRITPQQARSGYALEVLRRQTDGRWLLAIGDPFTVEQWSAEHHKPAAPESTD